MNKTYPGEKWKPVVFDAVFTNEGRLEVSSFGRIRSFNKLSDGNIIKGSMINGYRILRLKLFLPRAAEKQQEIDQLQQQVIDLTNKLKSLKENKSTDLITSTTTELATLKLHVSKVFKADTKVRTVHKHYLFHRLVADYFLAEPTKGETIVGHLDHNKLNNRAHNLRWMTTTENFSHQQKSPHVIEERKQRGLNKENSGTAKLSVIKVMLLKKLLNQGKPVKQLVKLFKVTDIQIYRIKRGENWADIKAAN